MRTFPQVANLRSHNANLAALSILLITIIGVTTTAFTASVSRNFSVTASVVRSCRVSISEAGFEKSIRDANHADTDQRVDPIVTIACSHGAAQNVLIRFGRNLTGTTVRLTSSRESIQRSQAIVTDASNKRPIETKRDDTNSLAPIPTKMSYGDSREKASVKEKISTDYLTEIVSVDF